MANHKSSIKRIRQSAKLSLANKANTSRMRTYIKKVRLAVEAKDSEAANLAFKTAMSEIARAGRKGVVHKNNASRHISRLNAAVKSLSVPAA